MSTLCIVVNVCFAIADRIIYTLICTMCSHSASFCKLTHHTTLRNWDALPFWMHAESWWTLTPALNSYHYHDNKSLWFLLHYLGSIWCRQSAVAVTGFYHSAHVPVTAEYYVILPSWWHCGNLFVAFQCLTTQWDCFFVACMIPYKLTKFTVN